MFKITSHVLNDTVRQIEAFGKDYVSKFWPLYTLETASIKDGSIYLRYSYDGSSETTEYTEISFEEFENKDKFFEQIATTRRHNTEKENKAKEERLQQREASERRLYRELRKKYSQDASNELEITGNIHDTPSEKGE